MFWIFWFAIFSIIVCFLLVKAIKEDNNNITCALYGISLGLTIGFTVLSIFMYINQNLIDRLFELMSIT